MKIRQITLLSNAALALAASLLIAPNAMATDKSETNTSVEQPDNAARNVRDRDSAAPEPAKNGLSSQGRNLG